MWTDMRSHVAPSEEAAISRRSEPAPQTQRRARLGRHDGWGGTEGNELRTSAPGGGRTGVVAAGGFMILNMRGLLRVQGFVGVVLIPPVLVKLASTGYRFLRYYTGSRAYV